MNGILKEKLYRASPFKQKAIEALGEAFKPKPICEDISYDKRFKFIRNRKYFMAINLHDNQEILPQMLGNLIELITFIPPKNLYLSIFESGSNDDTKSILKTFSSLLDPLEIKYNIFTSPLAKTSQMNRIEYLAYVRNLALEPLFKEIEVLNLDSKYIEKGVSYDAVVFLNDIFYCVNDILELLYQQALNNAHMVSGIDYDAPDGRNPYFYGYYYLFRYMGSSFNEWKECKQEIFGSNI